jgi:hypothetical protein
MPNSSSIIRGNLLPLVSGSLYLSLFVQWVTLIINFFGLSFPISPNDLILKDVLVLESIVQVIELIFYSWYGGITANVMTDVAVYRYYDWIFTTPMMLFSTIIFYEYQNRNTQRDEQNLSPSGKDDPEKRVLTVEGFLREYWMDVLIIGVANFGMLLFGYLQEIGVISLLWSTLFGFIGFGVSFYWMWSRFAVKTPKKNGLLYGVMFVLWGMYGIAALFTPAWKNISYNLLDMVAKNFYGVFLVIILYMLSRKPDRDIIGNLVPDIGRGTNGGS